MPTSSTLLSRVETKTPGVLPGYGSMAKTHAESYTHSDIGLESNVHTIRLLGIGTTFSEVRPDPTPPERKIRIKSVKSTRKPVYLNTEPPQKTAGYKAEDELTEAEVWTLVFACPTSVSRINS
ncbi:hypothetical protein PSTT_07852 [Puccinia striiformis]|uniref:Uncharacterized protein n=1 Tax=Puccinia striiformis TaxID=27350 RepID=A0A2S4VEH4_9BASI|nr:hypothetical protein PSTT_07852 [Puccinia striiformis]